MATRVSSLLAPADKMPVSVLAAVASFLLFIPSCPSAAINPGFVTQWTASNGDFLWEDDFYPVARKPSTSSLNPRLTWLTRGGTQLTDGGNFGPMQKRGGGVAMVRRHPSAAVSYAATKRQRYMSMPYHPLARFRGVDSPVTSNPVIGPYRPSPPFALPLGVASYGPRPDAVIMDDDGTDEDEFDRESDAGSLSAGQLLSILSAVARERGVRVDRGRINKGLRFGMARKR